MSTPSQEVTVGADVVVAAPIPEEKLEEKTAGAEPMIGKFYSTSLVRKDITPVFSVILMLDALTAAHREGQACCHGSYPSTQDEGKVCFAQVRQEDVCSDRAASTTVTWLYWNS